MRNPTTIPLTLFTALAASFLNSCAVRDPMRTQENKDPVCVVVENYHFNDVRVYVERDGVRQRLGTVEAMIAKELRIPARVLAGARNFRLIANPIASPEVAETHGLQLIPGCHTHWYLGQNLMASRVVIR